MSESKVKSKKRSGGFIWALACAIIAVALLLFCQFFFVDNFSPNNKFLSGTTINGIDVSGMTKAQAQNIISYSLLSSRADVKLKLKHGDKSWTFSGNDFEIRDEVEPALDKALKQSYEGNLFERYKKQKNAKKNGLNINVSYKTVLGGLEEKVEQIASEIDCDSLEPIVAFNPNAEQMFTLEGGKEGESVDRQRLFTLIDDALSANKEVEIEIPVNKIDYSLVSQDSLAKIGLRSKFSTSYATSSKARKNNVATALEKFNGMVVFQDEEVSFNQTTGARTADNGYKQANIILNGAYVKGTGGGVCQASTTLYNALVLADVDVLQVSHHSLPASYVPLSFDAMVAEGLSDLVFKNTTGSPIYIKTYSDSENVYVEIYGKPFEEGKSIRTRAEFIKVLPHSGDKIIEDVKGEYADKVLYKGEYFRLRYPREGYESKGYVQYLDGDELISEKEIRHDFYYAQDGIIVEGTGELGEGMRVPENDVQFIPPQKITSTTNETVRAKIEKASPSAYNP